jgi:hypothetical protein
MRVRRKTLLKFIEDREKAVTLAEKGKTKVRRHAAQHPRAWLPQRQPRGACAAARAA